MIRQSTLGIGKITTQALDGVVTVVGRDGGRQILTNHADLRRNLVTNRDGFIEKTPGGDVV